MRNVLRQRQAAVFCFVLALWQAAPPVVGAEYSLSGMASLHCSGVVVHLGKNMDARAILLTNGHCYDRKLKPGVFVADREHRQSISLLTRDNRGRRYNSVRILYAVVSGTDLALMELDATYRELAEAGIDSYEISPVPAAPGEAVFMVSGYWESAQLCSVERVIPRLLESPWEWNDSYKLSGCRADRQALSGSPLVSSSDNRIVGVFNTANDDGQRCTLNNPCEANSNGDTVVQKGGAYAQRVDQILTCLDSEGRFNVDIPSCLLFHGRPTAEN